MKFDPVVLYTIQPPPYIPAEKFGWTERTGFHGLTLGKLGYATQKPHGNHRLWGGHQSEKKSRLATRGVGATFDGFRMAAVGAWVSMNSAIPVRLPYCGRTHTPIGTLLLRISPKHRFFICVFIWILQYLYNHTSYSSMTASASRLTTLRASASVKVLFSPVSRESIS